MSWKLQIQTNFKIHQYNILNDYLQNSDVVVEKNLKNSLQLETRNLGESLDH